MATKRSCGIPHLRRISSRREGEGFQEPTTTPLGISVTRSEAMPLAMINLRWYSVSTTIRSERWYKKDSSQRRFIIAKGIASDRVTLIPNGVVDRKSVV